MVELDLHLDEGLVQVTGKRDLLDSPAFSRLVKSAQVSALFPTINIGSMVEKIEDDHTRTVINFEYSTIPYTLIFTNRGMLTWATNDFNYYGIVELYSSQALVIGLDIFCNTSGGVEHEKWNFRAVRVFAPGEWMRHSLN